MKDLVSVGTLVGLTVVLGACQGAQVGSRSTPVASAESAQVAADPTLAPSGVAPRPLPSPLLPSTPVLERLPQVRVGRTDPFSAVPVAPIVVPQAADGVQPVPLPPAPVMQPVAPPTNAVAQTNPAATSLPPVLPAPLPVAVQPAVSETIEILGIVQVGNRVSAIVRVPQEGTSRYVEAGEYLANGSILVRRIEVMPNRDPRVILVQNGAEVVRTVGDSTPALVGTL